MSANQGPRDGETTISPALRTTGSNSLEESLPSSHANSPFLSPSSAPSSGETPRRIAGRYDLLNLLGEGGMGQVYRAHDSQLNEVVALKMLHKDMLGKPEAVHRFKQEARLARRVTHPNVARTFDLGEADGTYYLTMEFVDGESLSSLIQRNHTLSLEETVRIGSSICAGLSAAHEQTIIHRDLKPDNILLANNGRVVLTDFGIARLESGAENFKTKAGMVVGTPTYMAPEQIEGKGLIDARTDIYALGCILFEMLAGSPAWLGNDFIVLATARFMKPPPDLRERKPNTPNSVAQLLMRCMARYPKDRFSSAAEVTQALQNLDKEEPSGTPQNNFPRPNLEGNFLAHPSTPSPVPTGANRPWSTAAVLESLKPKAGKMQVAVLPFRNRGNSTEAHLLEGLMDDLIDTLSMTEGLEVRSRGMVLSYHDKEVEPTQAGRTLGVDVIVAGSIQTVGEQLRIRTQLISTQDGNQIWAQRFPCNTSDFFDASDTIAQEIAKALKIDLALPERNSIKDSAAIDLYLRARYELRRSWTDDVTPAIQLFDQARELDPDNPQILSGSAIARARFAYWSHHQKEELQPAKHLAERALAVAPTEPETLFAVAMVRFLDEQLASAISMLEKAIEVNPAYADAHDLLGRILLEIGPLDKATHHLRLALGLDATLFSARWDLMRAYAFQEQWSRLEDLCILPVSERMDIAVRAMTTSRFFFWRPNPQPYTLLPDDEVAFITPSVLRFARVIEAGGLSQEEYQSSLQLIQEANSPRLKTLLLQFLAEQLAFSHQWDASMDAISQCINLELWDRVWLQHCPLFKPMLSNPHYQQLQERLEKKLAPRLALRRLKTLNIFK